MFLPLVSPLVISHTGVLTDGDADRQRQGDTLSSLTASLIPALSALARLIFPVLGTPGLMHLSILVPIGHGPGWKGNF